MINTLTLINAWEMFREYEGYRIYPYTDIYENPFMKILLLLMPIVIVIPLIVHDRVKETKHVIKTIIVCLIILCLGLALAPGTNPSSPFAPIYNYLLKKFTLMLALRNSTKFNHYIAFSYSLAFPLFVLLVH